MMRSSLYILILIFSTAAQAQLSSFDFNGYAKYLFSSTKLPDVNQRYDDHLLHVRLNSKWYPDEHFTAVMEMRFRAYYGESVEHTANFVNTIKGKYDYLNLESVLWDKKKSVGYAEIDRLYLDWNYNKTEITFGRQRIAWGTSWVWNPIDIFNPLSVLDFDYEERPAVDAARIQYYTGDVSKVEFAFKPSNNKKNIIAAGLLSINQWDYDFNIIAGTRQNRWITGAAWSGDIAGAGFRGEILLSQGRKVINPVTHYSFGSAATNYSFVLSGDYTFPNTFYIHTELLHNSNGTDTLAAVFQQQALDLGLITPARWSVYQEFAYDFHPLVRGTIFALFNPDDKSYAIVPSVTYSVITNLDLLGLVMFFNGKPQTEFGNYGTTAFLRLKYSF